MGLEGNAWINSWLIEELSRVQRGRITGAASMYKAIAIQLQQNLVDQHHWQHPDYYQKLIVAEKLHCPFSMKQGRYSYPENAREEQSNGKNYWHKGKEECQPKRCQLLCSGEQTLQALQMPSLASKAVPVFNGTGEVEQT